MRRTWWMVLGVTALVIAVPVIVTTAPDSVAFPRWSDPDAGETGWCTDCHGRFTDTTSPKGTNIPTNKHEMHRSSSNMNSTCNLCHTNGDSRNPFMASSNGASGTGYGCAGCHGRLEDGVTHYGAGLRQHHFNTGITLCFDCHNDADPANFTTVGEEVFPPYYGVTADTLADEPCNPTASSNVNENWSTGDFLGLDNDGDNVYDTNDTDCIDATPGEVSKPGVLNPMLVTGHSGGVLSISYDAACGTTVSSIEYGDIADLATYTYAGQQCGLDNSGTYDWTYPASPESFFFLVVGNDGTNEGSYGKDRDNGPPVTETERPNDTGTTCASGYDITAPCN